MSEITSETKKSYKIPSFSPYNEFTDALWIVIEAYKLTSQKTNSRNKKPVEKSSLISEFVFLAPVTFAVSMSHTWEPYESIISRFAGVVLKAKQNVYDLYSTATGSGKVVWGRVDTPLVYVDSERLNYIFNFDISYKVDNEHEITEPIMKLLELSSPDFASDQIDITNLIPPCIFKVRSHPNTNYIYIENAALTSVQPTYYAPFTSGYPSKCELTLQFTSVEPTFKNTFSGRSKVDVREVSGGVMIKPDTKTSIVHGKF